MWNWKKLDDPHVVILDVDKYGEEGICGHFFWKITPKWRSSGKNVFDFVDNWGYNVGKRHFFGVKVS